MQRLIDCLRQYRNSTLMDYDGRIYTYSELYRLVETYRRLLHQKSAVFIEASSSAVHTLAMVITCLISRNLAILSPAVKPEVAAALRAQYPHTHTLTADGLTPHIGGAFDYPDEVNILLFTSGTGGEYRGVMLTRENMLTDIEGGVDHFYVEKETNIVCVLPLYHGFGLNVSALALLYSGCHIYFSKTESYFTCVRRVSPAYFFLTPELIKAHMKMHALAGFEKSFGQHPKYIFCGGDFISEDLRQYADENHIELFSSYGLTEAAPSVSAETFGVKKRGSVGKPIACNTVEIVDGEIVVHGSNIMYGYYDTYRQGDGKPVNVLYTGDLGRIDEEGYLYVTGRKKNLLVFDNGKKIFAEAIESKLAEWHNGCEFLAYLRENRLHIEYFGSCTERQIRDTLGTFLSPYHITARILKRERPFARTLTGKIKRVT